WKTAAEAGVPCRPRVRTPWLPEDRPRPEGYARCVGNASSAVGSRRPHPRSLNQGIHSVMRCLVFLLVVLVDPGALQGAELPKVLFLANPMSSDDDVIRRPREDVPSVAERHFARLSQGVFDVTITQDGAEVTRARLTRYQAVVFFTAINPPGVDVDGLI